MECQRPAVSLKKHYDLYVLEEIPPRGTMFPGDSLDSRDSVLFKVVLGGEGLPLYTYFFLKGGERTDSWSPRLSGI